MNLTPWRRFLLMILLKMLKEEWMSDWILYSLKKEKKLQDLESAFYRIKNSFNPWFPGTILQELRSYFSDGRKQINLLSAPPFRFIR